MIDVEYSVAEEKIHEKQRTEYQRRRKRTDSIKVERGKENIKLPYTTRQVLDLKRIKRISDLPEE